MAGMSDLNRPLILVGTRPEIIKMAPIIRALRESSRDFIFFHTGQHHDYNLSLQFIEELDLPRPHISLVTKAYRPDEQLGLLVERVGRILRKQQISMVLVEGDTNSVLAGALAANKLGIPIGHVEAGLRSHDLRMPEEHNRRIVDHISNYLFSPTRESKLNLTREHVWGNVYVTGNTIIDACIHDLGLAEKRSRILSNMDSNSYALATIHRAENVDNPRVLKEFVNAFVESPIRIVLPLHPRSRNRLKRYGLWKKLGSSKNLTILPPLGYFDFLVLMKHCDLILTDSGGVQEEATAPVIRKKVVVLRKSTDRPEALRGGFARIAGCDKNNILRCVEWAQGKSSSLPRKSPFGDGHAAERIVDIVKKARSKSDEMLHE